MLVKEVYDAAPRFEKIIFSSWSDHIKLAKDIVDEVGGVSLVEFCDCGQLLPLIDTLQGNFRSFLAQHQQVALGIDCFDLDSYVLRIRADFKAQVTGHFQQFVDVLDAAWRLDESKCLVLAAGGYVPCFFEDRILMLTPGAALKIKNLPMINLYYSDHHNMYPEYLIYSSIMRDCDYGGVFLNHDSRYRGDPLRITEYDRRAFGVDYETLVNDYIERFQKTFVFLADAAARAGVHPQGCLVL